MFKNKTQPATVRVLGELEQEIMEIIWSKSSLAVREVYESLRERRKIAYTTVMTIMDRLYIKRVLKRKKQGKTYYYAAKESRQRFYQKASKKIVQDMVSNFGDVAIAQFVSAIDQVDPKKIRELRNNFEKKS